MKAADYRRLARESMKGKTANIIIATLIYSIITAILGAVGIGWIILGIFSFGYAIYMLQFIRGGNPSYKTLIEGFNVNPVQSLLTGLLTAIFTVLWSCLFLIPGLIKGYSYSMSMFILADHPDYTWKQCIDESRRIMNGNKWRLFCLELSFIGWYILGSITCGIVMLWVVPYVEAATAEFYESIKDTPVAQN